MSQEGCKDELHGKGSEVLPACLFPLPLHLWLMEGDARGWGWMDRGTVQTEFWSSAILALVWGSDHSHSGLWLPCSWSGQSFCPCLLFPLPPPPMVYNTHKRRQDLEARLQILLWDLSITCWACISYSLEAHLAVNFLERNLER